MGVYMRLKPFTLIALLVFAVCANTVLTQYPWSPPASEPYPWLDYLAGLTQDRNVELLILTRHEASIQTLTRTIFLNSTVAQKLGITRLRFIYAPAELWPKYIEDAKAKGTPIDVAWGGGPTLFNTLDEKGYLMPINPSQRPEHYAIIYELSKIPEKIAGADTYKRDSEGNIRWIGASVSSFGFTVNHDILSRYNLPKPTTWDDLTSPVFARYLPELPLIGIADPTLSTSNLRIFEIILQAKGWESGWRVLTLIAANSRVYPGSGDARDAAIRGDTAVSTTIDFYGYMAMAVNPKCEYVAPSGETIVNADPIAILKDTRYPVHAAAFVAWVLSEYGGQMVWLDKDINRIPINPRIFETPAGRERPDLKAAFESLTVVKGIEFNETLSAMWVNAVMYYFKATLVNAHDDLQSVWAAIAKAYLDGRITKEQFEYLVNELAKPLKFKDPITGSEVTFTLEYAIFISPHLTKAEVYQALMSTWTEKAREKYMQVYQLLQDILRGVQTLPTTTPTETIAPTTPAPTPTTPPTQTTPETPASTPASTTTPTQPPQQVPITAIALGVVAVVIVVALILLLRRK
jgi:ABC-type Fe3+ transport system substrate-binding protein